MLRKFHRYNRTGTKSRWSGNQYLRRSSHSFQAIFYRRYSYHNNLRITVSDRHLSYGKTTIFAPEQSRKNTHTDRCADLSTALRRVMHHHKYVPPTRLIDSQPPKPYLAEFSAASPFDPHQYSATKPRSPLQCLNLGCALPHAQHREYRQSLFHYPKHSLANGYRHRGTACLSQKTTHLLYLRYPLRSL